MKYVGKMYVTFHGLLTKKPFSIERGKTFEAIEGDVPEQFGTPVQIERKEVFIGEQKVETASVRKPGKYKK